MIFLLVCIFDQDMMMLNPTTYSITASDGLQLAAFCYGSSAQPPLVLVHGYPDHHTVWERVIAELVNDFFIIAYDVRGAGASDHPKKISAYRLPQLSRDLAAVTQHILGERSFHLAAHDWGSVQSWESVTAAEFAGKILSYSTISGPSLDLLGLWVQQQGKKNPLRTLKMLQKSWYIGAFHLPVLPKLFWYGYSAEKSRRLVAKLERSDNIPLNPHVSRDGRAGLALYRANTLPRAIAPRQRFAQCPVQAIILKHDAFVPPTYVYAMQTWCSDWHAVELEGNHWAILSQPQPIAAAIKAFALAHHQTSL